MEITRELDPIGDQTGPILLAFLERHRLTKIGFTFNGDLLSGFMSECFQIIQAEIDDCERKERGKNE